MFAISVSIPVQASLSLGRSTNLLNAVCPQLKKKKNPIVSNWS